MCQTGKARQARKRLLLLLELNPSKAMRKGILDNLLLIENYLGRTRNALDILRRRRPLGYRNVEAQMDAALETATLLSKMGQFEEARTELVGLLRDRRSTQWHGILQALYLYTTIEEQCQRSINDVASKALRTAVNRFGISLSLDHDAKRLPQSIRAAHSKFESESRAYSQLLTQVLTTTAPEDRRRVANAFREFRNKTEVKFFRDLAASTLKELTVKN